MILDYPMLRDLAEYNRNQVRKAYAAAGVRAEPRLPRRGWWTRLSHVIARTAPTPSPTIRRAH